MDESHLQYGARIFCSKLAERGIPFVDDEFIDSYPNIPYRFDISFAAISRNAGKRNAVVCMPKLTVGKFYIPLRKVFTVRK